LPVPGPEAGRGGRGAIPAGDGAGAGRAAPSAQPGEPVQGPRTPGGGGAVVPAGAGEPPALRGRRQPAQAAAAPNGETARGRRGGGQRVGLAVRGPEGRGGGRGAVPAGDGAGAGRAALSAQPGGPAQGPRAPGGNGAVVPAGAGDRPALRGGLQRARSPVP